MNNNEPYNIKISISLLSFKENDNYIIYSPALDLSGYGKNLEEAKGSFSEALNEFCRYTINKGTFSEVLKDLGWNIKKKKNTIYQQPYLDDMLRNNKYLSNIVRQKEFNRFNQEVNIPV